MQGASRGETNLIARVQQEFQEQHGVSLQSNWCQECLSVLELSRGCKNLENMPRATLLHLVLQQFLLADVNDVVSEGALPANVHTMHNSVLKGSYLLQIDELVNIEASLENSGKAVDESEQQENVGKKGGYQKWSNSNFGRSRFRTLKFSLTDGHQRVFGLELKHITGLSPDTLPGSKIKVTNVLVRRGLLLLTPQCVQIIGGSVARLIAALERSKERRRKRKRGENQNTEPNKDHDGPQGRVVDSKRAKQTIMKEPPRHLTEPKQQHQRTATDHYMDVQDTPHPSEENGHIDDSTSFPDDPFCDDPNIPFEEWDDVPPLIESSPPSAAASSSTTSTSKQSLPQHHRASIKPTSPDTISTQQQMRQQQQQQQEGKQHPSADDCSIDECTVCSARDCPSKDPLHYHHDGCPSCDAVDKVLSEGPAMTMYSTTTPTPTSRSGHPTTSSLSSQSKPHGLPSSKSLQSKSPPVTLSPTSIKSAASSSNLTNETIPHSSLSSSSSSSVPAAAVISIKHESGTNAPSPPSSSSLGSVGTLNSGRTLNSPISSSLGTKTKAFSLSLKKPPSTTELTPTNRAQSPIPSTPSTTTTTTSPAASTMSSSNNTTTNISGTTGNNTQSTTTGGTGALTLVQPKVETTSPHTGTTTTTGAMLSPLAKIRMMREQTSSKPPQTEPEPTEDAFSLGSLFPEEEEEEPIDYSVPFTYLRTALQQRDNTDDGPKTITIKGSLQCVIKGTFQYASGTFSLDVRIEDGTSSIVATMSDDVVASLVGMSCSEFKANLQTKEGKEKNKACLASMEEKLFGLEAIMDILLPPPPKESSELKGQDDNTPTHPSTHETKPVLPIIIATRPPTLDDIQALSSRLKT